MMWIYEPNLSDSKPSTEQIIILTPVRSGEGEIMSDQTYRKAAYQGTVGKIRSGGVSRHWEHFNSRWSRFTISTHRNGLGYLQAGGHQQGPWGLCSAWIVLSCIYFRPSRLAKVDLFILRASCYTRSLMTWPSTSLNLKFLPPKWQVSSSWFMPSWCWMVAHRL